MLETIPQVDLEKCDGCGVCVECCPSGATGLVNNRLVIIKPENCTYCTECEASCPQDAIRCPFEIVVEELGDRG
ncbi:MAG: 4Fe-4S binding protein [Chloroflexi bacterium]|nr:4Fe-4S binding protein [Chloroflexota bacterium]